jgi:hypothetical protein
VDPRPRRRSILKTNNADPSRPRRAHRTGLTGHSDAASRTRPAQLADSRSRRAHLSRPTRLPASRRPGCAHGSPPAIAPAAHPAAPLPPDPATSTTPSTTRTAAPLDTTTSVCSAATTTASSTKAASTSTSAGTLTRCLRCTCASASRRARWHPFARPAGSRTWPAIAGLCCAQGPAPARAPISRPVGRSAGPPSRGDTPESNSYASCDGEQINSDRTTLMGPTTCGS